VRPSNAKVELDFQEVFHQKVGNDLVTPKVLEIENVTSPSEDRLIYTLKFRFESNDEKIKAFIAKQERDLDMWGGFPDRRAVSFAKSFNGRERLWLEWVGGGGRKDTLIIKKSLVKPASARLRDRSNKPATGPAIALLSRCEPPAADISRSVNTRS